MTLKKYYVGDVLDFKFEVDGHKGETKVVVTELYADHLFRFKFFTSDVEILVKKQQEDSNV